MAITKTKKQEILSKLEGIKNSAKTLVFVHFEKLPVKESTQMRAQLRQEGVGFLVAKKTLLKKVFAGYEGEMPTLNGEIAIAYAEDEMTPAQNMKDFGAKYKESLSIVGGVFQGVYRSQEEMVKIASIPSLQVLRGMFAQVINSPRQRFAVVLSEVAKSK